MGKAGQLESNRLQLELHTYVWENKKADVEALLKQGNAERIVRAQLRGRTALHVAVYLGDEEVVDLLVSLGRADIHARGTQDGKTPLHLAALFGHEAVVKKLLEHGAASDLSTVDTLGDTPLHNAAQSGNPTIIEYMLSAAGDGQQATALVLCKNKRLRTPLHYAAASRRSKAVAMLVSYLGGDQSFKHMMVDACGALPFHFAAFGGDAGCIQMLAPEDVNVECNNGLTALHYAAWKGRVDAVNHLLQMGAALKEGTDTALHFAAVAPKGRVREDVVNSILSKFPESWKMANGEGELAIDLAHNARHGDVVRRFLQLNWSKFRSKGTSATFFHYAAAYGDPSDIKWLEEKMEEDQNVNAIFDKWRRTPIHWAAMLGNTKTLEALAELDADLIQVAHTRGAAIQTPLFLALEEGHIDFATMLLRIDKERVKNGAKKKPFSMDEWLHGVDQWFKHYYNDKVEESVKVQLESGFRDHTRYQKAPSQGAMSVYQEIPPVYLALHAGRPDIAKFLQQQQSGYKDAVNMKGKHTRRTALHWAVLFRRLDVVEQLCMSEPEFTARVRVSEEDANGISPAQYAMESDMSDIESALSMRDAEKDYIAGLYRDRQLYVDSTNAILVGAALIASVTFAGWLQPPLGFVEDHYDAKLRYAAMRHVPGMRVFWTFNSLSFFTAIGAVLAGACGVLPLRHVHIRRAVGYIRRALMVASSLMALSVVCVLGAFGAAGFIVLPPKFKFEVYMMVTLLIGGLINAGLIVWFLLKSFVPTRLTALAQTGSPEHDDKGVQQDTYPTPSRDVEIPPSSWPDDIKKLYIQQKQGSHVTH